MGKTPPPDRSRPVASLVAVLWLLAGPGHLAQAQGLQSAQHFQPPVHQFSPPAPNPTEQTAAPTAVAQPVPVEADLSRESGSWLELGRGLWQRLSASLPTTPAPTATATPPTQEHAAPVITLTPRITQPAPASLFGPDAPSRPMAAPAREELTTGPVLRPAPYPAAQDSGVAPSPQRPIFRLSSHLGQPATPFPAPAAANPTPALADTHTTPPASSAFLTIQSTPSLPGKRTESREESIDSDDLLDDLPVIQGINLLTPPRDLWQRVRNGFAMSDLDSPLVATQQAWYLNRPGVLKNVLNRGRRYLYFIVEELEKRGMPTELALLPMVESSYNPMAYSRAHASGLWQLIPSTGKNYQLEQNGWQDQRRDIIASTGAALEYLQYIYELHGDWHLALASYNWGEGAVGRAIARNRNLGLPTDYASLRMPDETRYYVPKLQALKNIIAQPELFGLQIDPIPNQPYFDTVDLSRHIDISIAAKLAEIPLQEFLALNPSYNRPMMPADNDTPIVLPTDKVDTFLANLEQYAAQDKPLTHWDTYVLKRGENLTTVAKRHGLSLAYLRRINGLGTRSRVATGATLMVPGKGAPLVAMQNSYLPTPPGIASAPQAKGKRQVRGKRQSKVQSTRSAKARNAQATRSKKTARRSR